MYFIKKIFKLTLIFLFLITPLVACSDKEKESDKTNVSVSNDEEKTEVSVSDDKKKNDELDSDKKMTSNDNSQKTTTTDTFVAQTQNSITVGITPYYAPFAISSANGMVGFGIDLIEAIQRIIGPKPVMSVLAFPNILVGVESGTVNFGLSGILQPRVKKINDATTGNNPSDDYVMQAVGVLRVKTYKQKFVEKIGVLANNDMLIQVANAVAPGNNNGNENENVKQIGSAFDLVETLRSGQIDCALIDVEQCKSLTQTGAEVYCSELTIAMGDYIIISKQGSTWPKMVSTAITTLKSSGDIQQLRTKWKLDSGNITGDSNTTTNNDMNTNTNTQQDTGAQQIGTQQGTDTDTQPKQVEYEQSMIVHEQQPSTMTTQQQPSQQLSVEQQSTLPQQLSQQSTLPQQLSQESQVVTTAAPTTASTTVPNISNNNLSNGGNGDSGLVVGNMVSTDGAGVTSTTIAGNAGNEIVTSLNKKSPS